MIEIISRRAIRDIFLVTSVIRWVIFYLTYHSEFIIVMPVRHSI